MRRLLEWEYSFRYAKKAKSMQTLGTWMRARRPVQPAELVTWMLSHVFVRMDSKNISGTPPFTNYLTAAPESSFQFLRARYANSILLPSHPFSRISYKLRYTSVKDAANGVQDTHALMLWQSSMQVSLIARLSTHLRTSSMCLILKTSAQVFRT